MPSTGSARGPLLWVRALLLATVALLAGTLAHVSAHGVLPGPAVLTLLLLAGTAAAAPLLRREASRRRIVALVVLGQAAVHAALTLLGGHHGEETSGGAAPAWLEHLTADLTGQHALMAVGHAGAAAVVGLWLAAGERILWALLRDGGRLLRGWLAGWPMGLGPVSQGGRAGVVPARAGGVPGRTARLTLDAPRRGPPLAAGAARQPAGH